MQNKTTDGHCLIICNGRKDKMYRAGILTLSDKGARGEREDRSAGVIEEILKEHGYEVAEYRIIPDDYELIKKELLRMADESKLDLILTTGGTGLSRRDVTPEATKAVMTRDVPGIAEAMREDSLKVTRRAMLSRAASVVRNETLIINLPGSPKAVRENLMSIISELKHGLDILTGRDGECAQPDGGAHGHGHH